MAVPFFFEGEKWRLLNFRGFEHPKLRRVGEDSARAGPTREMWAGLTRAKFGVAACL